MVVKEVDERSASSSNSNDHVAEQKKSPRSVNTLLLDFEDSRAGGRGDGDLSMDGDDKSTLKALSFDKLDDVTTRKADEDKGTTTQVDQHYYHDESFSACGCEDSTASPLPSSSPMFLTLALKESLISFENERLVEKQGRDIANHNTAGGNSVNVAEDDLVVGIKNGGVRDSFATSPEFEDVKITITSCSSNDNGGSGATATTASSSPSSVGHTRNRVNENWCENDTQDDKGHLETVEVKKVDIEDVNKSYAIPENNSTPVSTGSTFGLEDNAGVRYGNGCSLPFSLNDIAAEANEKVARIVSVPCGALPNPTSTSANNPSAQNSNGGYEGENESETEQVDFNETIHTDTTQNQAELFRSDMLSDRLSEIANNFNSIMATSSSLHSPSTSASPPSYSTEVLMKAVPMLTNQQRKSFVKDMTMGLATFQHDTTTTIDSAEESNGCSVATAERNGGGETEVAAEFQQKGMAARATKRKPPRPERSPPLKSSVHKSILKQRTASSPSLSPADTPVSTYTTDRYNVQGKLFKHYNRRRFLDGETKINYDRHHPWDEKGIQDETLDHVLEFENQEKLEREYGDDDLEFRVQIALSKEPPVFPHQTSPNSPIPKAIGSSGTVDNDCSPSNPDGSHPYLCGCIPEVDDGAQEAHQGDEDGFVGKCHSIPAAVTSISERVPITFASLGGEVSRYMAESGFIHTDWISALSDQTHKLWERVHDEGMKHIEALDLVHHATSASVVGGGTGGRGTTSDDLPPTYYNTNTVDGSTTKTTTTATTTMKGLVGSSSDTNNDRRNPSIRNPQQSFSPWSSWTSSNLSQVEGLDFIDSSSSSSSEDDDNDEEKQYH